MKAMPKEKAPHVLIKDMTKSEGVSKGDESREKDGRVDDKRC